MFGNNMMKKLQEMQAQMEEIKQRLDALRIDGESANVKVTVNGSGQVMDISGGDGMDKEELMDHIILASNKALEQANKTKELEMAQSARGILPGM